MEIDQGRFREILLKLLMREGNNYIQTYQEKKRHQEKKQKIIEVFMQL